MIEPIRLRRRGSGFSSTRPRDDRFAAAGSTLGLLLIPFEAVSPALAGALMPPAAAVISRSRDDSLLQRA
jgi:hypothetical protein